MQKSKKYGPKRYQKRTYRYSRIPRNSLSNDSISAKLEVYGLFSTVNGSPQINASPSGSAYINIVSAFGTDTWADYGTVFNRYKITGVSIRANYCVSITDMTTLVGFGPNICMAFYPNQTSNNMGDDPLYNDSKAYLESNSTIPVTRYWKCPDGFMDGGSTGFGQWTNNQNYGSQIGQISIAGAPQRNAGAAVNFANYRLQVYVIFSGKKN